jgi:hypothetical protein
MNGIALDVFPPKDSMIELFLANLFSIMGLDIFCQFIKIKNLGKNYFIVTH